MQKFSSLITALLISLASCTPWAKLSTKAPKITQELTQRALFLYLANSEPLCTGWTSKGLDKIDVSLRVRDTCRVYGNTYFEEPMRSDLLKLPLPTHAYQLSIPDSLAHQYELISDDQDYEHDFALIYQFSPLLPTHDPEIYLMEIYIWDNCCEGDGCVRILSRRYLRFKIQHREITELESIYMPEKDGPNDFIGFGGFPRKMMDEALPGDKITKFGW